ncbi:GNAT family N-acetyltransferase [Nocardiopsis sp. MG754419]|uniref:GNAT family N-acetyltransferase n=1 Tax=Nocardiopsis sp. MG754419 TaxID=2259865 RepID=UPI001BA8ADFF|nr:GNAT family N-acetyltransferase [Nocardiopsis sp. MG754419]MBR8742742.1 N-acetyltransferase [Nocardiopsis sp. MG754419]
MTTDIRPLRRADIPQAFRLLRASHPCRVLTEALILESFDHPLTFYRDRRFVAVEGDEVVGYVLARLHDDDRGLAHGRTFLMAVAPSHLDGALHARLLTTAERHLVAHGATTLRAEAAQESVQVGGERLREVLADHGYARTESARILGLDLSSPPEPPAAPEGSTLRTFAEFDDPRPIYEIDRITSEDEPGEDEGAFPTYTEWHETLWNHPLTDKDLSLVLLVDGVPRTISCYRSDGADRMESGMTGTLPGDRSRGFAAHTKAHALRRAWEKGIRHAFTGNHAGNGPMLAINERLGYTLVGTEETHLKR